MKFRGCDDILEILSILVGFSSQSHETPSEFATQNSIRPSVNDFIDKAKRILALLANEAQHFFRVSRLESCASARTAQAVTSSASIASESERSLRLKAEIEANSSSGEHAEANEIARSMTLRFPSLPRDRLGIVCSSSYTNQPRQNRSKT
jgi:hypothetical protein